MTANTIRCDRCQHWQKDSKNEEWEARGAGFGECEGVRERWRITDEAVLGLRWDQDGGSAEEFNVKTTAALKRSRAYVQDGSQYRAELFTAPDFFCALFMEKVAFKPSTGEIK